MPTREQIVSRYVRQYQQRKEKRDRRRLVLLPFRLVFGIGFAVVAVYFIIQIFLAVNTPMTTATALSTTVNDEYSIVGYFVRDEMVLEADYQGVLVYLVNEGDKVARYGQYAAVYSNEQTADIKNTITQLDNRIKVLEAVISASTDPNAITNLSTYIYSDMNSVATLADSGSYTVMDEYITELKSNIITRELNNTPISDIETMVTDLKAQRDNLEAQIGASETLLTASVSGYFTSNVDGYESILNVDDLDTLTPSEFENLTQRTVSVSSKAVGKLVTGYHWYFVSNMRTEEAVKLTNGGSAYLNFDSMGDDTVKVTVESISKEEGGEVTVVFSCMDYMAQLISLRKQSAVLVMNTYEGLKVPREAVRVDSDGNLGVYVITGMYSEFKNINVLYETEDYYIVETDPSTTKSLLVYDLIIVNGKGLSNGKVLK